MIRAFRDEKPGPKGHIPRNVTLIFKELTVNIICWLNIS